MLNINLKENKRILIFSLLSILFLGTFVLAENNPDVPACNTPICTSLYDTGETDSNGCVIYTCANTTSPGQSCSDSDGGLNYFIKGQTVFTNLSVNYFIDSCLNSNVLVETYCNENNIAVKNVECLYGCNNGACFQPPTLGNSTSSSDYGGDMGSCLNNPDFWWDQQTNKCYKYFSKELILSSCSDLDGGANKYIAAHTFGFRSSFADSKDQRIRTGGKDSCISDNQLIEHYCDSEGFIRTSYLDCPNGCVNDVCVKGDSISEKITCIFKGSKSENECYIADANSDTTSNNWCKGTESCSFEHKGEEGEQLTWKSSCGGYQYTLQDGLEETIVFDCSIGENISNQVKESYFRNAYWKCENGKEFQQGGESSCNSYGLWKKYAYSSCNPEDYTQFKIVSFSVSNSCYPNDVQPIADTGKITQSDCDNYLESCKNGDNDLCIKWETSCKTPDKSNDSSLLCKDSCPLDNKCYPFGYRKEGKFCSDSGAFNEQLKEDSSCDNNFECSSNVCVNSKCISSSLIEKVIGWFKSLFA